MDGCNGSELTKTPTQKNVYANNNSGMAFKKNRTNWKLIREHTQKPAGIIKFFPLALNYFVRLLLNDNNS